MAEDNRGERLASLESEVRFVKDIVSQINDKLDNMQSNYVPRVELEQRFTMAEKRLDKIESSVTWAWRALITGMFSWMATILSYILFHFKL